MTLVVVNFLSTGFGGGEEEVEDKNKEKPHSSYIMDGTARSQLLSRAEMK